MPSPFKSLQLLIAASLCFFLAVPAGFALSPQDLPAQPPDKAVLDSADVLSRAGKNEIETRLNQLESSKVDARVITVRKLDYGLSLTGFGEELVERWSNNDNTSERPLILFLEETQNKQAAVVVSAELSDQLPDALLRSTARTTMSQPMRDGERFRQASMDGIERIAVVLNGGEDPGPPIQIERTALPTNVPTVEETSESNAFTWVIVLLVVGTIVPMATWWVFSR
ncbi:MAG: TPM domain-containing protein [Synechococcus sp.]|nr:MULTISPECIES: TPM domain-containing protein [unclassified Synechococcus]MCH9772955.1 TPM domain-containing protein [Cyanobacteriota bacterium]MDA7490850.1 TPM domain-containing protein [Synechococcus sp. AH-707-M23]MDB4638864.1 TPM domain-containing protein [bacterium]MDC0269183.1 TPM domain-containing protein [Synechococcus sp. AH-551-N23]MDB4337756.1 TPM domain-containing protein [Synechococcus sp. AH-603-L18]